jgi:hypothetical protein
MMSNEEDRSSGPPPPGHEHHPAPRLEHHHSAIVAGSHGAGGESAGEGAPFDWAGNEQLKAELGRLAAAARDHTIRLAGEAIAYIRESDLRAMLRDARELARRRPEVLIAGTILTGLVVASLLRASTRSVARPSALTRGHWYAALKKGTQAASVVADALKQGAEARSLNPEAVVGKMTRSRLWKVPRAS